MDDLTYTVKKNAFCFFPIPPWCTNKNYKLFTVFERNVEANDTRASLFELNYLCLNLNFFIVSLHGHFNKFQMSLLKLLGCFWFNRNFKLPLSEGVRMRAYSLNTPSLMAKPQPTRSNFPSFQTHRGEINIQGRSKSKVIKLTHWWRVTDPILVNLQFADNEMTALGCHA